MTTVPRTDAHAIEFFRTRVDGWAAEAAELGLTVEEAEQAREAALAAQAAYNAATAARQAAESATVALRDAIARMRERGSAAIGTIKARAISTGNPSLLSLARLSPANERRAPLPPAQPRIVAADLNSTGAVTLRWRVRHTQETRAEGTAYFIERQLPGQNSWTPLGATGGGAKRGENARSSLSGWMFTDTTLPRGLEWASYRIVPRRAGIEGPASGERKLNFGAIAA